MALNRNVAFRQGAMMDMTCVLRVNPQCPECKNKLNEVLQCTRGQYSSIMVDGEAHKVKITGRADPNQLLQILSSTENKHGEAILVQIRNKAPSGSADERYYYDEHGNPYNPDPRDATYAHNNGYYPPAVAREHYYDQYRDHYYDQYYHPGKRCSCNIL